MCVCSYKGHQNEDYKVDSCLTHDDAHVVSGSEDGRVCFWDLVEVCCVSTIIILFMKLPLSLSHSLTHTFSLFSHMRGHTHTHTQGKLIHSFPHVPVPKSSTSGGGRGGAGRCVIYSLAHHPKDSCLLTAGSHGPARVWKKKGWEDEEEKKDEES